MVINTVKQLPEADGISASSAGDGNHEVTRETWESPTLKMLRDCTKALGLTLLLVLVTAESDQCSHLREIHNRLQRRNRVSYMKHNMPLNYTFKVHYEENYMKRNMTRLRKLHFTELDLKILWVYINTQVFESILHILPRKHPSRKYVENISKLFKYLREEVQSTVTDFADHVEDIIALVHDEDPESKRKDMKPKTLLDNCYRVMIVLFNCSVWNT